MKIQFESNQEYQLSTIKSVIDIFEGQSLAADDLTVEIDTKQPSLVPEITVGNKLVILDDQMIKNLIEVQKRNSISETPEVTADVLTTEDGQVITTENGHPLQVSEYDTFTQGRNFTIEMETGTGKTYVYLRTIHELYKTYGFKKFIIVVPSVAIKEGVIKNLEITREHFDSLYSKPKMDWYVWDPKKRGQAKQFATNDALQIMVINIDSFAKSDNIINQESDWGVPVEYIQATNPIVIVDEPQNMETDKRRDAISSLNPLCTLRYSATHKYPYNMVYRLDPVRAYDLGLVKKIEVDSVLSEDAFNSAYIYLQKIENKGKNGLVARLELDSDDSRGLQRKVVVAKSGTDLYDLTKRSVYDGYVVDEIDAVDQSISFANGKTLFVGQKDESLHEQIVKYQIRRTIENHMDKELRLQGKGIKVLSLFFIDKVSNYRVYTDSGQERGKFAIWFEEAYKQICEQPKYQSLRKQDVELVHNGYFSADNGGSWKDTRGNTKVDDQTYELIMKDKERLLNIDEPLKFIFSHSALREGWDNPNVFQICTLNETRSDMKKRQEIGRGLRLPVDSNGIRVRDDSINILTVVANESYEDFAVALQAEIEDETGIKFGSNRIKNKRERRTVRVKKGYALDENFKDIWEKIQHKTRYNVSFDSEKLIDQVSERLDDVSVTSPRIVSRRTLLNINDDGIEGFVRSDKSVEASDAILIPNILAKIQSRTKLTRKTIYDIISKSDLFDDILKNPQQVIDEIVYATEHVLREMMVDGIKYEHAEDMWEMKRFENEELEAYLNNVEGITNQEKTLYDHILVDSDIERSYAKELEAREDVKFYFKLPYWFKIDTPIGDYNPDWAVIFEDDKRVYFVAETKGVNSIHDDHLRQAEKMKILCGDKHFRVLDGVKFIAPTNSLADTISKISD